MTLESLALRGIVFVLLCFILAVMLTVLGVWATSIVQILIVIFSAIGGAPSG